MAQLSVNGLDGLMDDLLAAGEIPDAVAEGMLTASAVVVEEAQIYTGMQMGVYRTGETLASIGHSKLKRGRDGLRCVYVSPQGTNDRGERNAAVAYINEYGAPKRGIPARPFIRTANELAADSAAEASAAKYDEFLKSKNL